MRFCRHCQFDLILRKVFIQQEIYDHIDVFNESTENKIKIKEIFRITYPDTDNSGMPIISNNVLINFSGYILPKFVFFDKLIIPVFIQLEKLDSVLSASTLVFYEVYRS